MMDMACPRCRAVASVPFDRLNSQLRCRKCSTKFYMDTTGRITEGDKPSEEDAQPDPLAALARVPRGVWGAMAVGALVVLAFFAYRWTFEFRNGPPETLNDRAEYVAQAFAHNETDRLKLIAAPGTDADVMAWYEKLRPEIGDTDKPIEVMALVEVQSQDKGSRGRGASATTLVTLMDPKVASGEFKHPDLVEPPPDDKSPGSAATKAPKRPRRDIKGQLHEVPSYKLTLIWTRDDAEQWRLDGTKTLQTARPPKSPRR